MRFFAFLLSLSLLLAFPASSQQDDAENARRVIASIEQTLKQRPTDPHLWFYLSRFNAVLGETKASVAALEKVNELGEGFLPTRDGFAKVWEDSAFQSARARLESRLPRLDYAPTAFEIEDRTLLPEGIAYDAPSRTFFMGSIQGRIFRIESGAVTEFVGTAFGLDPLLGLAVDAPRRILYAVTTSALTAEGRRNLRNAVVAFDIDTRKQKARYDVPNARQLNDVAVGPGGRVFATDSAAGAVYEIAVKGPGPSREVVAPGRLGGSNGLAVSPDGKRLFVAHSTGLAVVDLASGEMKRVNNDTRENVGAIDGLYQWQGQLIGVQNFTTPGRVIVMTLSPDGSAIKRVQTLLSHHHNALNDPTTGAVTDQGFYLLAATGITHFNAEGKIDRPESVPNPLVVRIPLPR